MQVIKRDGRVHSYDSLKIFDAVYSAAYEIYDEREAQSLADAVWLDVSETIRDLDRETITVEDVQSLVIDSLYYTDDYVAELYTRHKTKHDVERIKKDDLTDDIYRLINKDTEIVDENANKDGEVFSTQRDLLAGVVNKNIGLGMLPERVAEAHKNCELHWHDLDYSPFLPLTNCSLIDVQEMQKDGFKIGNAEVSRPHSIQTATAQIAQIVANVASSQYGGTSLSRLDEHLSQFAEMNYCKHIKDAQDWGIELVEEYAISKTKKDIYDAMQSLEYEINTLFTTNGQTPQQ
jgi:ribonucleoside-triphosphate reductase